MFVPQVSLVVLEQPLPLLTARKYSTKLQKESEDFEMKYVEYFTRDDIDGWQIRKGVADLMASDLVPRPEVIAAALRACRRVDDFSLVAR